MAPDQLGNFLSNVQNSGAANLAVKTNIVGEISNSLTNTVNSGGQLLGSFGSIGNGIIGAATSLGGNDFSGAVDNLVTSFKTISKGGEV